MANCLVDEEPPASNWRRVGHRLHCEVRVFYWGVSIEKKHTGTDVLKYSFNLRDELVGVLT